MAIFTIPGKDVIRITDNDYINDIPSITDKVHIIRLDFKNPDNTKMEWVISKFYTTNRYIVDNTNIKYYNYFLKRTNLKYYIINNDKWNGLISFYKRNNKVLLDITLLSKPERDFVLKISLLDILQNTEVIIISKDDYQVVKNVIDKWRGNCIIQDPDYLI